MALDVKSAVVGDVAVTVLKMSDGTLKVILSTIPNQGATARFAVMDPSENSDTHVDNVMVPPGWGALVEFRRWFPVSSPVPGLARNFGDDGGCEEG